MLYFLASILNTYLFFKNTLFTFTTYTSCFLGILELLERTNMMTSLNMQEDSDSYILNSKGGLLEELANLTD